MRIRFTRGVANTPAGAERDVSRGAADRLVRAGDAVYAGSTVESAAVAPLPVEPVGPGIPRASDHKAAWVDYAVSRGQKRADAEGLTKRNLIALLS